MGATLALFACQPASGPSRPSPATERSAEAACAAFPAETGAVAEGVVDRGDALELGTMYWANPRYVLGEDFALIVGGTVVQLARSRPTQATRGEAWIVTARIEVERVFLDEPLTSTEHATVLGPRRYVVAELADGLSVGDKVIVAAIDYEGAHGLVEAKGSNARLGLRIADWSDPIVGAVEAFAQGRADLSDPAQAAAWRCFGAPAVDCMLRGESTALCGE